MEKSQLCSYNISQANNLFGDCTCWGGKLCFGDSVTYYVHLLSYEPAAMLMAKPSSAGYQVSLVINGRMAGCDVLFLLLWLCSSPC